LVNQCHYKWNIVAAVSPILSADGQPIEKEKEKGHINASSQPASQSVSQPAIEFSNIYTHPTQDK